MGGWLDFLEVIVCFEEGIVEEWWSCVEYWRPPSCTLRRRVSLCFSSLEGDASMTHINKGKPYLSMLTLIVSAVNAAYLEYMEVFLKANSILFLVIVTSNRLSGSK